MQGAVLVELVGGLLGHSDGQVGGEHHGGLEVHAVGGLEHGGTLDLRGKAVLHVPLALGELVGQPVHDEVALAQALDEGVEHAHRAEGGRARDLDGDLDLVAVHVGDQAVAVVELLHRRRGLLGRVLLGLVGHSCAQAPAAASARSMPAEALTNWRRSSW